MIDDDDCIEQIEEELDFGPLASDAMEQPEAIGMTAKSRLQDWQLICPPKNWKEPVPIDLGEVRLLETLSRRLDLTFTRDDKRKKLYLGPVPTGREHPASSLEVGSAVVDSDNEDDSLELEDSDDEDYATPNEQNPNSRLQGQNLPAAGLRFGSGWVAETISDAVAGPKYEAAAPDAAAPLIRAFPDHQISKNFRLSEFRPGEHSYEYIRIHPALINILETIREKAGGQTLHVTSGYRPPAYNRKVGGVGNSTHIDGLAADIYCDHLSTEALWEICDRVIGDRGGVGFYPSQGFVHVDIRGYAARW